MFNLFDILQSQAGPGMQSIGQQFGLTPEQSLRAMNALLPALATGLQRSAADDPMGFGRMLGMAGANPYFGVPSQPPAPAQPDLLSQLFGSPMLSQAVLQQASSVSGIGQQALRQMLPVMAGMVVAGIVHVLVNQPPPAPAVRQPPPPPAPDSGFPVATFWNDWINQFLPPSDTAPAGNHGTARAPEPAPVAPSSAAKSFTAEPARRDEARPQDGTGEDAPFETFQQMFQTGVQVQEQNARAMQDIFDAFWSPPAHGPDAVQTSPAAAKEPLDAPSDETDDAGGKDAAARKRTARQKNS